MFGSIQKAYDIGAYKGSYTDFLLSRGAKQVFVFEPNTELYNQLMAKYDTDERVTVYNCLVGDKNELKPFYVAKHHHTISTASTDFLKHSRFAGKTDENQVPYEWHDPVSTNCYKLDTIFKNTGIPDWIKIDAEGFELEIMSGMSEAPTPVTVTFEMHEEFLDKFKKCINHLHDIGFAQFALIEGDAPDATPAQYLPFNEFYEHINLKFPTLSKEFFGMAFARNV